MTFPAAHQARDDVSGARRLCSSSRTSRTCQRRVIVVGLTHLFSLFIGYILPLLTIVRMIASDLQIDTSPALAAPTDREALILNASIGVVLATSCEPGDNDVRADATEGHVDILFTLNG